MRPGQIRVFDGLRVTTEHVDHFQASLHSAIQDVREILGLGVVHAGFGIAAIDTHTITVQPGLAFDLQKNRIVSDEPLQVEVSFGDQQDLAYVCAKYDQVEEGETEGRHTLIFDDCAILVRGTLPGAADNLVVLAQITRQADGSLLVTNLTRGALLPPLAEGAEPALPQPTLRVRQGVLRLASGPAEGYPGQSLVELLRSSQATVTGLGHDLMLTLATAQVPADFSVASLTAHVLTSVAVTPQEGEAANVSTAAAAEATCSDDGVTQFSVSPLGTAAAAVAEDAMARVAFIDPGVTTAAPFHELLKRLAIVVRAERAGAALNVVCRLVWTDITTAELITQLEVFKPGLTWRSLVAWKAIGQM